LVLGFLSLQRFLWFSLSHLLLLLLLGLLGTCPIEHVILEIITHLEIWKEGRRGEEKKKEEEERPCGFFVFLFSFFFVSGAREGGDIW